MDLYSLLGVDRAATPEAIERAYRRLARRYHPGINPGDRVAAETFRKIQDAYGVLSDRERRRDYDCGGARPVAQIAATVSFEGFDFTSTADGAGAATFSELFSQVFQDAAREATTPTRGADIEAELSLSFEHAARGGEFPLSVVRRDRCPSCAGAGHMPRPATMCPGCGGQGVRRAARGHMVFTRPCDVCDGTGRLAAVPCRACGGAGVQTRGDVVTVRVPAGLEPDARMALPGRGHAGARGGPPGDLYVTVRVAPHPHFRREGRDLHLVLPVAVHEAALGARVVAPALDGQIAIRIPPGTSSGHRLRVRGRGLPGPTPEAAGDLVIEVQLVLPSLAGPAARELMKEFGRLHPEDVRRHLFD
jgi:molecular chaperone DnaJ